MAKIVRYRTSTGATVTFTPDDGDGSEMPRWECSGCGEQEDGLTVHPGHAQGHADWCRALPD